MEPAVIFQTMVVPFGLFMIMMGLGLTLSIDDILVDFRYAENFFSLKLGPFRHIDFRLILFAGDSANCPAVENGQPE